MSTATAQAPVNVEVRRYEPSPNLIKLADNIKAIAKFDPGLHPIFEQATRIGAVNQLLAAPEMAMILDQLENNPAGYLTDLKGDAKYPLKERNQAVTQALSLGARLVNKEFTIIKGNAFLGKNFYQRMLDELGRLGSFTEACKYRMLWWDTEAGDIALNGNMASCVMTVRYRLHDKDANRDLPEQTFTRKFYIRTNSTDTPDLWIGKFERRVWQKLLRYLAGVDFGDDGDEGGAAPGAPQPPPTGTVSLAKEAPAAAPAPASTPAPAAEDASFTPVPPPAWENVEPPFHPEPSATPAGGSTKPAPTVDPKKAAAAAKADVQLGNAKIPGMPAPVMPAGTPPAGPSVASRPAPAPQPPPPTTPPPGIPDGPVPLF